MFTKCQWLVMVFLVCSDFSKKCVVTQQSASENPGMWEVPDVDSYEYKFIPFLIFYYILNSPWHVECIAQTKTKIACSEVSIFCPKVWNFIRFFWHVDTMSYYVVCCVAHFQFVAKNIKSNLGSGWFLADIEWFCKHRQVEYHSSFCWIDDYQYFPFSYKSRQKQFQTKTIPKWPSIICAR